MTAAEAPFVQVPSHINVRDGKITLINNDHTILGLRASAYLMPYLPEKYRLLPLLQSVWYIPARARHLEPAARQISRPLRDDEGHQCAAADLRPGGLARGRTSRSARRARSRSGCTRYMIATVSGNSRRSYGLFLGLAEEEAVRPALREQLEFLGLIDLQDTVIGRKARNTGHKAIRARVDHRPRQFHRLGALARRLLHGRARHGGRPALLLAVRCRLRQDNARVPGWRQEPEADQPDAAVAARGRGHASTC